MTNFIGESNILEGQVTEADERAIALRFQDQRVQTPRNRDVRVGQRVHPVHVGWPIESTAIIAD